MQQLLFFDYQNLHIHVGGGGKGEILEIQDIQETLKKVNFCFSHITEKYFTSAFCLEDLNHSDKYAIFLYYLGSILIKKNKKTLATKTYLLNKCLHSIDLFPEVKMPNVFCLSHPCGTVIGRARFQNYILIHQNCTIGGDTQGGKDYYPTFGSKIVLYANASVIGKSQIGDNVIFAANTFVLNTNIPSNSLVVGQYPNITIHKLKDNNHASFRLWKTASMRQ